jgi:2-aminoethylphosphonate-pyruvate transaminase
MNRLVLLNPGPVNLSERVRQALQKPDLCHREAEFATLQASIRRRLLQVYGLDNADWAAVLLTGSGTAAVEAMITSCMPRGGRLLVMINGVYGERIKTMAERSGIPVAIAASDWLSPLNLDAAREQLERYPDVTHVAAVHHETTTGRLNAIDPLAALCREFKRPLLLDAVSSFGAETINFDRWPIAACAATANKCLHGVPGASFVIVNRQAFAEAGAPARSLYLDLAGYLAQQDAGGTPFTQSVQAFYALDEALGEFMDAGGVAARQQTYRQRIERIRAKLGALGVAGLLPQADSSCVLQAFQLPQALGYEALHDGLKSRGFVIYAGQGRLAAGMFRISMMGDIGESDLLRLEQALSEVLTR